MDFTKHPQPKLPPDPITDQFRERADQADMFSDLRMQTVPRRQVQLAAPGRAMLPSERPPQALPGSPSVRSVEGEILGSGNGPSVPTSSLPERFPGKVEPLPKLAEVEIFMAEDVDHALKIFDAQPFDRVEAMRRVLMFALQVASINLGVR